MKIVLLVALISVPFHAARAEGEDSSSKLVKTEETVKLADEAAQGLFDRVRGAHLRAVQQGKVAATNEAPKS